MRVFILTGPTASGKSKIGIKIAQKYNCEIINIDCMQIYEEIPIISAIPRDRENVAHHLYGFTQASNKFSSVKLSEAIVGQINILERCKKNALLVGGSPFYISTLINGIAEIPEIDVQIFAQLLNTHKDDVSLLYQEIIDADKSLIDKITPQDKQRIIRAASILRQTGKSISHFYQSKKYFLRSSHNQTKILLMPEREKINSNIKSRTGEMFESGAINEVKEFLSKYTKAERESFSAYKTIGIREIEKYLNQDISLNECKALLETSTKQYVKKQMTWFRKFKDFHLINENSNISLF